MPADLSAIINLLEQTSAALRQKGIQQWLDPWNPQELSEDIAVGHVFILAAKSGIIGTFALRPFSKAYFFNTAEAIYFYRIAILPAWQSKNLGMFIMRYVKEKTADFYLDCWAGNDKLKHFYQQAGLYYCGDFAEGDYFVSVFHYSKGL